MDEISEDVLWELRRSYEEALLGQCPGCGALAWYGCDRDGHVAVFIPYGLGETPKAALSSFEAYAATLTYFDEEVHPSEATLIDWDMDPATLPESTVETVKLECPCGLYVFRHSGDGVYDPYVRLARPSKNMTVEQITNQSVRKTVEGLRFSEISFAEAESITVSQFFDCP